MQKQRNAYNLQDYPGCIASNHELLVSHRVCSKLSDKVLHDHLWNTLAKQNHPVILLRHNGEHKHLATPLSMYFLDMLVMDLFAISFTQNHYFYFYFLNLAFYFVPSLGKLSRL